MKPIQLLFTGLALLTLVNSARCVTITWTNASGGNWSAAANWSPHQVPTNADVVLITTPGTYTVTLDVTTDYRSFYPTVTLGAGGGPAGVQTLAMTNVSVYFTNLLANTGGVFTASGTRIGMPGQTLTLNGGKLNSISNNFVNTLIVTNGGVVTSTNSGYLNVTVAKGIFNSAADAISGYGSELSALTVASGGIFNEFKLTINGGSSVTVASGGVMNLLDSPVPSTTAYSTLLGPLTNYGIINLTNSVFVIQNNVYFGNGGLVNQVGGLINLRGNGGIVASVGYPASYYYGYIFNRGVITQTAGTNSISAPVFDVSLGAITNLSGLLSLDTFQTNLSGTYYAGPGATVQFFADHVTPGTPFVLDGNGEFQFASGTLNLPSNVIPKLTLAGGYLALGPGFQGGAITNLALNGIVLLSNSLPVTGTFAVTNSGLFGNIFVANGGVFTATNSTAHDSVTVGSGGSITANGFGMASPVTVAAGGVMYLTGTNCFYAPFTNAGTVNISNAVIPIYPGIVNQPGGLMDFSGNGSILRYDNVMDYFINRGKMRFNSPSGTNTIKTLGLDTSQGTVTNLAGTLVLGAFQTNLAGTFFAGAGATVQFKSSNADLVGSTDFNTLTNFATPGTPLLLNGGGQFQFTSGNLYLPANVPPNLALVGGVLKLGTGFQGGAITNLTFAGIELTNESSVSLPVTGTLTLSNCSGLRSDYQGKQLPTGVCGNITMASGGVLRSYSSSFNNNLTVAAGGLVSLVRGSLSVSTSGTLSVANGGTINIGPGGITLFGPLINAGIINISNPPPAFISGIVSANDGSALYRGGILNQASGIINLADDNAYLTTYNYGLEYLVNRGQIVKTGGTNYSVVAVPFITNSGAITVQSGKMGMRPFVTQAGGSLNVWLNSATNYGGFDISSNLVLAGAFNATLKNGYVPANGAIFNVLSYTSYSGIFSSLGLSSGVTWQTIYGGTNFTLVVCSAKPQFTALNLSGSNLIFSGIGGSPGSNYVVLVSTNLTLPLPNWSAVITNSFDGGGQFRYTNPVSPAKPRQFFIFKVP